MKAFFIFLALAYASLAMASTPECPYRKHGGLTDKTAATADAIAKTNKKKTVK